MEDFLHFVWQNRLYQKLIPKRSLEGKVIEVLDTGVLNKDAGADFFNAKVRIDGLIWVGAVEIHRAAHQWYEHKHDQAPNYQNVILHIVEKDDHLITLNNGEELPCCEMQISKELRADIQRFFQNKGELACSNALAKLSNQLDYQELMKNFRHERFEQKLKIVEGFWLSSEKDWAKTLYLLLMRYFGFGINNDVMEYLARSLDLRLLLRHKPKEQEALLLGQAGLIPYLKDESYASELEESYNYLKYKHQLEPLPPALFKRLRTRPRNFPNQRIKQFITLLNTLNFGADVFEDCSTIDELHQLLRYGKPRLTKEEVKSKPPLLSKQASELLIINVVAPFWVFSQQTLERSPKALTADFNLWQKLPAEQNKITRLFARHHFPIQTAGDSQALIYLYQDYCQKRKCFFCPFGREALTSRR